MTILNAVRAYDEIAKNESKAQRREWCRKHFLNERTLLEARKIRGQLADVCRKIKLDPEVSCGESEDPVITSLGYGLVGNAAFLQQDGSYKQTMGHAVGFSLKDVVAIVILIAFDRLSRFIQARQCAMRRFLRLSMTS